MNLSSIPQLILAFLFVSAPSLTAQQVSPSLPLLQSSAKLLSSVPIHDVTIKGTVTKIAGSSRELGSATLQALVDGSSRMDIHLSSGDIVETRDLKDSVRKGSWNKGGVTHSIPYHNLFSEPAWFFPTFAVIRGLAGANVVVTYVGAASRDGIAVQHLRITQSAKDSLELAREVQSLSQLDLYLDSSTLLPLSIEYNEHPDNNARLNIPIKVNYSDYRMVGGAEIPFHIEQYRNYAHVMDVEVDSAEVNSAVSESLFSTK